MADRYRNDHTYAPPFEDYNDMYYYFEWHLSKDELHELLAAKNKREVVFALRRYHNRLPSDRGCLVNIVDGMMEEYEPRRTSRSADNARTLSSQLHEMQMQIDEHIRSLLNPRR
jgi:hypothetical protein